MLLCGTQLYSTRAYAQMTTHRQHESCVALGIVIVLTQASSTTAAPSGMLVHPM